MSISSLPDGTKLTSEIKERYTKRRGQENSTLGLCLPLSFLNRAVHLPEAEVNRETYAETSKLAAKLLEATETCDFVHKGLTDNTDTERQKAFSNDLYLTEYICVLMLSRKHLFEELYRLYTEKNIKPGKTDLLDLANALYGLNGGRHKTRKQCTKLGRNFWRNEFTLSQSEKHEHKTTLKEAPFKKKQLEKLFYKALHATLQEQGNNTVIVEIQREGLKRKFLYKNHIAWFDDRRDYFQVAVNANRTLLVMPNIVYRMLQTVIPKHVTKWEPNQNEEAKETLATALLLYPTAQVPFKTLCRSSAKLNTIQGT